MPAFEKKWGPAAERDLALAIIFSQGGEKPKFDWPKIHGMMTEWGYSFTKDAMGQRWSKTIMKEFNQRRGEDGTASPSPAKKRKANFDEATGDEKITTPRKRKTSPDHKGGKDALPKEREE